MQQIDSHLHVWNLDRLHYHWLTPEQPTLYRNYLPDAVYPQMHAAGIDAAVLVEAANLTAEIPFLIELASQYQWVAGVVGWMSGDDQLAAPPDAKLCGARIPTVTTDELPMLPEAVERYGLPCDLIVNPNAYRQAISLIESHPATTFVLDHFACAPMIPRGDRAWKDAVRPLAAPPNVVMKVSGYLTAAQPQPLALETLRRYIDAAADLFGARRLMYGSDYPICTLVGTYDQSVTLMRAAAAHLSTDEQAEIMGGTAIRAYGLAHVG